MYREPNKTWVIIEEELQSYYGQTDWQKLYNDSLKSPCVKMETIREKMKKVPRKKKHVFDIDIF